MTTLTSRTWPAAAPMSRYPQRPAVEQESLQGAAWRAASAAAGLRARRSLRQALDFAARVSAVAPAQAEALLQQPAALRKAAASAQAPAVSPEAFAALCAASRQALGLDPHPLQVAAAFLLLQGTLAEMATGEGKTLVVALAAAMAALQGWRVHAMTANDYLAARDAQGMGRLHALLGLPLGCVVSGTDEASRRAAYRSSIVYTTAKEAAFDWLRDRVRHGEATSDLALDLADGRRPAPILSGLSMAIVDEADAILLDEARTPLILAVEQDDAALDDARRALSAARLLMPVRDFTLAAGQRPELTPQGLQRCAQDPALRGGSPLWAHENYRAEQVTLALVALHVLARDRDYVLQDGGVHIVDPNTGRIATGRRWSGGLHRLVELKEGLACGASQRTLAAVTYQRFFPRYLRLAGTSGTLQDARLELAATYRLPVVPMPLQRSCLRQRAPSRVFACRRTQAEAIVQRVRALVAQGRPVLVGTGSVEASERVSRALSRHGVAHAVLNARQDADEAAVVAQAGQPGRVTVSTAMAGRGTDIQLGPGVAANGGLAVLIAAVGRSSRIERQLTGRAARHGDPGSVEILVALDDPLLLKNWGETPMNVLSQALRRRGALPPWLVDGLLRWTQRREAARDRDERRLALEDDLARTRALALTGAQP